MRDTLHNQMPLCTSTPGEGGMAKKSSRRGDSNQANEPENEPPVSPQSRTESRRAQRVLQERQAKRRRIYTMFGGAAAAAILLVLILILINRDDSGEMAGEPVRVPPAISADIPRDGRTLGDPDAPVRIVEYGDFQCPGCATFATSVKPQLVREYIATGQVVLEYRDLTGLGTESRAASIGAACALEQGMFWEFYDILYYNQSGRDAGGFSERRMLVMAEQLEMDVDEFEGCLGTDRFDADLEAMTTMAGQDNIRATPTLLVNGVALEGPNFDQLRQQIETALSQAGS
jgi:protein-disulfide isomerase